jgi:hypothetical protein
LQSANRDCLIAEHGDSRIASDANNPIRNLDHAPSEAVVMIAKNT